MSRTFSLRYIDDAKYFSNASFVLMKNDLKLAENISKKILAMKSLDHELLHALFASSIVYYSKCFVSCSGARLHASQVFKNSTEEEKEFHKQIIQLRHKAIAHNDEEMNSAVIGIYVSECKIPILGEPSHQSDAIGGFPPSTLNDFINLIKKVSKFVEIKLDEIKKDISEYCKNLSLEELQNLPKVPHSIRHIENDKLREKNVEKSE